MEKINRAKQTIEEQTTLIQNLEEQMKNNELIIKAYTQFVEFERKKAGELYEPDVVMGENKEKKG